MLLLERPLRSQTREFRKDKTNWKIWYKLQTLTTSPIPTEPALEKTPFGEIKIPEPMIVPTIRLTAPTNPTCRLSFTVASVNFKV